MSTSATSTTPTPVRGPRLDGPMQRVLAARTRPARPSALRTSLTFGWRGMLKIKHVPEQLFDVTLTPILFTLMFTYLFGGAIAGSTGKYLQYLLPGILVQTVMFVTVYTGFTLNTDITKGVFDRFRSLPIWRPSTIVGSLLGDAVRYLIASAVVMALGLVLGFRPAGGVAGVLLSVLLLLVFSFGLGWIFTTLGLLLRTPNAVMGVGMLVLMPLTFVSNIFVDPATMPSGLQAVVHVNPVSNLVTAIRSMMAGTMPLAEAGWAVLAAAVIAAVFAPLTMYLYRTKS